jgi:hypothetical protein
MFCDISGTALAGTTATLPGGRHAASWLRREAHSSGGATAGSGSALGARRPMKARPARSSRGTTDIGPPLPGGRILCSFFELITAAALNGLKQRLVSSQSMKYPIAGL